MWNRRFLYRYTFSTIWFGYDVCGDDADHGAVKWCWCCWWWSSSSSSSPNLETSCGSNLRKQSKHVTSLRKLPCFKRSDVIKKENDNQTNIGKKKKKQLAFHGTDPVRPAAVSVSNHHWARIRCLPLSQMTAAWQWLEGAGDCRDTSCTRNASTVCQ